MEFRYKSEAFKYHNCGSSSRNVNVIMVTYMYASQDEVGYKIITIVCSIILPIIIVDDIARFFNAIIISLASSASYIHQTMLVSIFFVDEM